MGLSFNMGQTLIAARKAPLPGDSLMQAWFGMCRRLVCAVLASAPLCTAAAASEEASADWRFIESLDGKTYAAVKSPQDWDVWFTTVEWVFPQSLAMLSRSNAAGERMNAILFRSMGDRRFAVALSNAPGVYDAYAHPDGKALTIIHGMRRHTLRLDETGRAHGFGQYPGDDNRGWYLTHGFIFDNSAQVPQHELAAWTQRMTDHPLLPDPDADVAAAIASAVTRLMEIPEPDRSEQSSETGSEQTPAGAQAFISLLGQQGRFTIEAKWRSDAKWNQFEELSVTCDSVTSLNLRNCSPRQPPSWQRIQYPAYAAEAAEPLDGNCRTLIWADLPNAATLTGDTAVLQGAVTPPFMIDWSAVSQVEQSGQFIVVSTPWPQPQFRFDAGDDPLGARLAFAMEFLRVHCDPTTGTGF